jgi:hypothetical protein
MNEQHEADSRNDDDRGDVGRLATGLRNAQPPVDMLK